MGFSRYERVPVLDFGKMYGTSFAHSVIRQAIKDGTLKYKQVILHERERLDHIAGRVYENSRYWWVIAAASEIGWALQVPPGTIIRIPPLVDVARLVG